METISMSICQSKKWEEIDRQIRKNLGLPQFTSSHQAPIEPDTHLVDRYGDFFSAVKE